MIKNQRVFWSGQYLFPDSDDPGDEPDVGLLEGTVTFVPVWDASTSGLLSDSQRSTYVKPFPVEIRDGQLMSNDDGTWIPGVKIPASIGGHPLAWVARFDLSAGSESVKVRELRFTSNPDGEVHLHNVIPAEAIYPQLPLDVVKGDSVTNIYTQGQYVVFIVGEPPRTKQYVLAFPGTDEAIAAAEAAVAEFEIIRDEGVTAIAGHLGDAEAARDQALASRNESQGFRNEAEGFKNTATTQAGIATTKAGEAAASATAAQTARTGAETARTGAETARTGAETARTGADGFKSQAAGSASAASDSAGQALAHRDAAEGFKDQALNSVLTWKGAWSSGTSYVHRDVVSHNGSSWWAKQPSAGVEPTEGATWSLVASKGEQGEGITSAADLTGALTDQVDASEAMTNTIHPYTYEPLGLVAMEYVAGYALYAVMEVDGKADEVHTHTRADITGLDPALTLKADLDANGKLVAAQLPALAITEFLGTVASQAAMLGLTGQRGDWCVRTDRNTQWILVADNPAVIGSWREMVSPAAPVSSVAGRTGAVTLSKSDVGLASVDNTSDASKPISTAVSTALAGKAASSHTHTKSDVGLSAVDNTSDAAKPISTATQAALTPLQNRSSAAPATWRWNGTTLPTAASQVHAQARTGDFIVAPNLTTDPGWHQITGV